MKTIKTPRKPQKQNLDSVDPRDTFQTPNYATDIIVPYLKELEPALPFANFTIWECAQGLGKMVKRLRFHGLDVIGSDLSSGLNFLTDEPKFDFDCIVTNTPFSLKEKFFKKCLEYNTPFALLIPALYSTWLIDAVALHGCEKIIPARRIDYITPNILKRIWEGETWSIVKEELDLNSPLIDMQMYIDSYPMEWQHSLVENEEFRFDSIYDVPKKLLRKYSSSYFHSMWLTRGFNIGKSETFVELSSKDKDNI